MAIRIVEILNMSLNSSHYAFHYPTEAKKLLQLSLPLIISHLAQMGMNFTDTVMAGRHHETSLAGVAIGSSLWVPTFLFLMGVLMALTPMISQAYGANKKSDISQITQQGFWLALLLGLMTLLTLQLLSVTYDYIDMETQVREQAVGYVVAVSFGLPALALFQVLRGLNEGAQLTRPYMIVSIVAVLVNIPLNYMFIYGKFGMPELGGAGCGWATAIVLWLEFFVLLFITLKNKKFADIQWYRRWQKPSLPVNFEILKLGVPIGIALLIESSMFVLIALFLAPLGSQVVAGHQIAMSVISILFMIPLSISVALTIRCGYCLGQQQFERARTIGMMGTVMTVVIAAVYCVLIVGFSEQIAKFYSTNTDVVQLATSLMLLAAIFQFSDAIQVSTLGILRGYKDTRYSLFVVILAYWVIGLPLGYSLGVTDFWGQAYGAQGFWVSLIVGLTVAALLLVKRFLKLSKPEIASRL